MRKPKDGGVERKSYADIEPEKWIRKNKSCSVGLFFRERLRQKKQAWQDQKHRFSIEHGI